MTSLADRRIAILGTGIAGLAIAYRLWQAGGRPTLFTSPEAGSSASACAQGVVANKGLIFYQSPLFAAKLKSRLHLQDWLASIERDSGMSITRRFTGVDEPYWTPDDFRVLSSRIYRHSFWGCYLTKHRRSGPAWPFAARPPLGYLHYPQDGWFDVAQTLLAIEKILKGSGLSFYQEKVQAFGLSREGKIRLELATGPNQIADFDQLILASGAGTADLLAAAGIASPRSFTIGGQTTTIELPFRSDEPQTCIRQTLSGTWWKNQLLLGSTSWKGVSHDQVMIARDRQQLLAAVENQMGWGLQDWSESAQSRVGTRLRFVDRMPALGTLPFAPWQQRLFICTGFYKNGLQLADLCALELLACIENRAQDRLYPEFCSSRLFKN